MRSETAPKANPAPRTGIEPAPVRLFLKASRSWTSVFVSIKHRQHEDRREKRTLIRAFLYRSDACHADTGEGGWKAPGSASRLPCGKCVRRPQATATSFL